MTFLRLSCGALAAALAVAACGGGAGGPGVMMTSGDVAAAPQCTPGTFQIAGVVDSIDRTSSAPVGNYGFANVGNPSTLTAEFGLGGSLQLQWTGTVADGATASAAGTLTLPPANGAAPQVYCVGGGSEIEPFAWGGKFLLTGLVRAPSADACSAPASLMPANGELLGCYGWRNQ
jgi:hypothetical protein